VRLAGLEARFAGLEVRLARLPELRLPAQALPRLPGQRLGLGLRLRRLLGAGGCWALAAYWLLALAACWANVPDQNGACGGQVPIGFRGNHRRDRTHAVPCGG
jgi:hypothetical protein